MAYTTINKSTEHFNTKLYTGNGSNGHAITGVGFSPSLVWLKNRSSGTAHVLVDAIRGQNKVLSSNNTEAEATTNANKDFRSFDSDGFTVDTNENYGSTNTNGANIVAWNWLANGAGVANTDGDINSTVSVNTTSGFSIVKFVGNSTAGATVGHGLGAEPKLIFVKALDQTYNWCVYSKSANSGSGQNGGFYLNGTDAWLSDSGFWNNTSANSSTFTLGSGFAVNNNGTNFIAYCFAEKQGYSKFGSYVGNNSDDGPFIYTGFKPAFVMIKNAHHATNWSITDDKRDGYNTAGNKVIYANTSGTEDTYYPIDHLSNGFKIRLNTEGYNGDGGDYIYMAFAEAPLVGSNNVPCTAR